MHDFEIFSDQHSTLAPFLALTFGKQHHVINVDSFSNNETKLNRLMHASTTGKNILYVHQFFSESQNSELQSPLVLRSPKGVSNGLSKKSINESLFNVLLTLESLISSGAKHITLLMPYLPYTRQEHATVLKLLLKTGTNKIITYDVHHQSLVDQNSPTLINYAPTNAWVDLIKKTYTSLENVCIASPDHGAIARTGLVAQALNVPLIRLSKQRKDNNQIIITDIDGLASGKNVIIIDDILDTGSTAIAACNKLLEQGAQSVSGYFSHAILSGNAIELLEKSSFGVIFLGNSMLVNKDMLSNKFKIVDMYENISKSISISK